jgi:hypothetical protein
MSADPGEAMLFSLTTASPLLFQERQRPASAFEGSQQFANEHRLVFGANCGVRDFRPLALSVSHRSTLQGCGPTFEG